MNDDEFKKQVLEQLTAMNGRFDKVEKDIAVLRSDMEERFDEVRADVRMVYDGLREVLDQQDIEVKERMHMTIVLNRHERWINGLARHTDLKLSNS